MSARSDLGKIIWETSSADEQSISATGANIVADAILAAGYSKPKVLGYIVVDRGGIMVGNQHKHEESAQAFAAEWSKDCKDAGIDWDYRIATITEATA